MSQSLESAVALLDAALQSMDVEMRVLEGRLDTDATLLRRTVEGLELDAEQKRQLLDVSLRIEATATQLASFVHRPPDAEAQLDRLEAQAKSLD